MASLNQGSLLPFEPGVVHVWAAWLTSPNIRLSELEATLSPDERTRGAQFVFPRDRQSYIASRGILRSILGKYTGIAPQSLVFQYNAEGKPSLVTACGGDWLHFNVSHSGSLALYAVGLVKEIGVDVEAVRIINDMRSIADRNFAAAEREALKHVTDDQYQEAFFTCWTRKEAFIKAVGTGLSYPLADFAVTLNPARPARFLHIAGEDADQWGLVDLRPAAGYIGAVAARIPRITVQLQWWAFASDDNG